MITVDMLESKNPRDFQGGHVDGCAALD